MSGLTEGERLEILGLAIKHRRLELGLSQEQLAYMIEISNGQAYLSRIESGMVGMGIDTLMRISDALDVPVRDLIDF